MVRGRGGPEISQAALCRGSCEEAEGFASSVRPEPRGQRGDGRIIDAPLLGDCSFRVEAAGSV